MRAPLLVAALVALTAGACAVSAADDQPQVVEVSVTGPAVVMTEAPSTTAAAVSAAARSATTAGVAKPTITDDRVYLVGDSITESISSRYSGALCDTLGPLGWDVTVDAVQSRTTHEAVQSLRTNKAKVGQVMVVLIGHNDTDRTGYMNGLNELLMMAPQARRILFLTNYEFEKGRDQMNDVLRLVAATDPRIELVDWNSVVKELKGAIQRDGLHLTGVGQKALAATIATALGEAPPRTTPTEPGCTTIRGARPPTTNPGSGSGSGGSGGSGGSRTTTAPTAPPTTTGTTSSGGGGGGGGGGGTTQPTATDAPSPGTTSGGGGGGGGGGSGGGTTTDAPKAGGGTSPATSPQGSGQQAPTTAPG